MRIRLAQILLLAAVLLGLGTSAGTAASKPTRAPILGVVPPAGGSPFASPFAASTGSGPLVLQTNPCTLATYYCWTMRTNTTYAIYWAPSGFGDANYEPLINRYFQDVAAASGSQTNVYSVGTQYYDNTAAIHYQSTFGGSYVDTNPFPASGCNDGVDSVCLTDAQIQTEIQNVLNTKGWHGSTTNMFFLMTPDGVGSCFTASSAVCTRNTSSRYCAYHSGYYNASAELVIYANEPYDGTIPGCTFSKVGTQGFPNDHDADAAINTISHEHNEAITDPWGNAWRSNDGNGDEIGDLCAWDFGSALGTVGGQPYNQVINGHDYSLQQEYSTDGDACLEHYSSAIAPTTFAAPVLTGVAGQGQLISTSEGSWAHAPTGYAYTWQRCAANGTGCADIASATSSSYTLTAADVGHTVRSEVSAHNGAGTAAFVASPVTAVVVALPSATAAPVLSGIAALHKQLSTTNGTWNGATSFTYAWLRCAADGSGCAVIPGATLPAYVGQAADVGHTLEARVTATNAAGSTAAVSNLSGVVLGVPAPTKAPHISGHAKVGKKLSGSHGLWTYAPTGYRYQWLRCNAHGASCRGIHHATGAKYKLTKHDAGHRLRLRITATNVAGSTIVTSAATARVKH